MRRRRLRQYSDQSCVSNLTGALGDILIIHVIVVRVIHCDDLFATDDLIVAVSTRLAVIIADIIVLVVTWTSTFATVKQASSAGVKASVSRIILQDGTYLISYVED